MTNSEHLVFIGDLSPYLAQCGGARKAQLQRLTAQADRYFSYTLPAAHPKGSTTYLGVAILNLALAYRVTREERYLQEARRFIRAVLGYEKWGNAHLVDVDLSAAWILFGLSLGYDWLRESLTETEREQITQKIQHHAQVMYDYRMQTAGHGWATAYYQNHNWIDHCGMAAAGYVLRREGMDGERYIRLAKENFARVYDFLPEDGSNYEGVVYWRYGGMWLFVYAHLLKTEEGTDYFQSCAYLKNTFYFRLYQSAPDLKRQMNFGDCHDRYSGHTACVYYKIAAEYGNGYAQRLGNLVTGSFLMEEAERSKVKPGILPEAVFEFLWYAPEVQESPLSRLPLTRYFPDLGLLCIRTGWRDADRAFAIKCGAPGGAKQWRTGWKLWQEEKIRCLSLSHHHPDNLSYVYIDGPDYLTCEDGYNRNILPENHNVLLVDGALTDVMDVNDVYMASARARMENLPGFRPDTQYTGSGRVCVASGSLICFRGDNAMIYPPDKRMQEVSRILVTDGLRFLCFVDRFRSEQAHIYRVLANTDEPAQCRGDFFHYARPATRYYVKSMQPIRTEQFGQTVTGVMTTQEPDAVCRSEISTLAVENQAPAKEAVFFECLLPDAEDLKCAFGSSCLQILGEKTWRIIAREGFAAWGIRSEASVVVTVTEADGTVQIYEI